MNDIHGVNYTRKFAVVLIVFGLVVFALVWNKNIQNLLPVAGLLRDLTLTVNKCSFKTAFYNINRFITGSEFFEVWSFEV